MTRLPDGYTYAIVNGNGSDKKSAIESPEHSNWQLIQRMMALAWQYRRGSVGVLMLHFVLLAMSLGALGLTGLGLAVVRHSISPESSEPLWPFGLKPPNDWSSTQTIAFIAGLILLTAIAYGLLRYASTVAQAKLVQSIIVTLRRRVYDRLQRLSFRFFDANESGSIINRVTTDVQSVRLFVDGVIIETLVIGLSVAFYLTYMLSLSVKLTLACLASLPVMWTCVAIFSRIVRPAYRENRKLVDRLVLTLSESVLGIRVVRGFAREEERIEKFADDNKAVRDQKHWIFRRVSTFVPSMQLLATVNVMVLMSFGGYMVIYEEFPLDQGLVVFAGLLQQFTMQISGVAHVANSMMRSLTGAQRVFEVLDTEIEIKTSSDAVSIDRAAGAIAFEGVHFGYNGDDQVLKDVTVQVDSGQSVGILGPTGAGKSTLLSLIPRFYDPAGKGSRVLLDGKDLRDYDLDDLRRQIGLVFQDTFLFSNTVAANIAFGHPEATMEQVEHAAKLSLAHEFIMELPKGYDTVIGENGMDLSGGQRQRLAIARAVLPDPPILLLDDATAAVDSETEQQILESIDAASSGRTTFLVTHRLSALRRSDRVIVMDGGRIVQEGTHDELMETQGHYQTTAGLQMADERSRRLLGMDLNPLPLGEGGEAPGRAG